MCVIYLAYQHDADTPLILIANRDEFYERPSAAAKYWDDAPDIYAGRDLVGGGTWLGVTRGGRLAAVTNYRDPSAPTGSRSRGELVAGFLRSHLSPCSYIDDIQSNAKEYSGFNLIVGQIGRNSELFYYSNRGGEPFEVTPGIYGLSNHLLNTPWPKVRNGRERFAELLADGSATDENLFRLLSDETLAPDDELPSTGIPFEKEKALSAIFIKTPGYGTRCSSVVRFDRNYVWSFEERVFV
jgi:uncharacterized protein with NRDE domain